MNWKIILVIALIIMIAVFVADFFNQEKAAPGEPGYVAPPGTSSGSGEVTVTVVDPDANE